MTSHAPRSEPVTDPQGQDEERDWLPVAAFTFVVLALIALTVIPGVLLRRVTTVAQEFATTILPANEALRDLAFAMEERVAVSRSRFLSNDPRYNPRMAQAKRAEEKALQTIEELAPRFGATTASHLESLRGYMARRDSIEAELFVAGATLEAYRAALPRFDAIRDSMLVELTGFRQELMRVTGARVAEEARWVELQRVLSFALGVVALLAAFIAGWFARRQRQLRRGIQTALEEANRQRAIAEHHGEELARATEARVRLLRGVTHDVKNPLGAAKGYAELLRMEIKAPLLPEQRPFVDGIQRSVDSALAMITDLLDVARADSGGLSVERVEIDLGALADAAVADHRSAAVSAGHTLEVHRPAEPLHVLTDPARVGQVLGNLLSNAIKYTPSPGRITVRSGIERRSDGETWATIRVSDTGPGIPPDQRDAIFDEFARLDDGGAQSGHGLGLAIARRIARLLDGDLTVEDAPGGGAAFILWLRAHLDDETPVPEREADPS
jgi:signal transduction histidine kinase